MATSVPPLNEELKETCHAFIIFGDEERKIADDMVVQLENKGFKCMIHTRDFVAGKTIVENMETGVSSSRKVIALISKSFIDSGYCTHEVGAAVTKQNNTKKVVFIPVVYKMKPDEIPTELKGSLTYLEYEDDDFWTKLERAIIADVPLISAIPAGDVAHGLAWSYYFGYLDIILPGLRDRVKTFEEENGTFKNLVPKLVIVMPESCKCPALFTDEDPSFKQVSQIPYRVDRAGNKNRDYKSTVYRVEDSETNEMYHFLGEFCTPLLSLYQMEQSQIAGLNWSQKIQQMELFEQKINDILRHEANQNCHNKAILIRYTDSGRSQENLAKKLIECLKRGLSQEQLRSEQLPKEMEKIDLKDQGT